jgi:hypothetical protein
MEIVDDFVIEMWVEELQKLLEPMLHLCDTLLLVHVLDDRVLQVYWNLVDMQRKQDIIKHLLYLLMLALLLLHLSGNTTEDIGNKESTHKEHARAKDNFSFCLRHDIIACDQQDRIVTQLDIPGHCRFMVKLCGSIWSVIQVNLRYPIVVFKLISILDRLFRIIVVRIRNVVEIAGNPVDQDNHGNDQLDYSNFGSGCSFPACKGNDLLESEQSKDFDKSGIA